MRQRNPEYSTDLASFIDNVMLPVESFSKIFMYAQESLGQPKAELNDVGTVTAALAALARLQLHNFADKLQSKYGKMEVSTPNTPNITPEVLDVSPTPDRLQQAQ